MPLRRTVEPLIGVGGLGSSCDDAEGNRRAEDLDIVIVHLVLEAGGPRLIETVELVEVDGVAIRHQQAMKGDGEALLAEAGNLLRIAEDECALGDQHVLAVLAVDRIGDHDFDRSGKFAVEPVNQHSVDGDPLEDDEGLAMR